MSNVLYPLSLIAKLRSSKFDRTLADEFEDGAVNTRRYWGAQEFKRRISIEHAPLTLAEYRYLRSFYSQRGRWDSFWLRDNVNRDGNVSVRFASELPTEYDGRGIRLALLFDEVAPIRALPEWDEVATAAGATPLCWYDANREIYYSHAGTAVSESNAYDAMLIQHPTWQAGSLPLGDSLSQYQHYAFTNSQWAKTSANLAGLTGSQPACTVFAIAKHGTISSKQVLFSVGAVGAGAGVGIAVSASNAYEPWIGGSETWGTASFSNSPISTWRSFAVTWADSSNSANLYVNGATALTESETRVFTAGPAALGAAIDGTLKCNGNVAHVLVFAAQLTQNQVKAVHNLLGYQYGLATV